MSTEQRVRDLVAPLFGDGLAELVDVEHPAASCASPSTATGGVDRRPARRADASHLAARSTTPTPCPGRYTLEVSSPGLERPLRTPAHFARRGRIKVSASRPSPSVEGERRVDGHAHRRRRRRHHDPPSTTVRGDARTVRYDDIERARTVFEWGPAPKPGPKPGARKPSAKKKAAKRMSNAEMMEALQALAAEKGISVDTLLEALADALESAYKRMPGAARVRLGHHRPRHRRDPGLRPGARRGRRARSATSSTTRPTTSAASPRRPPSR